MVLIAGNPADQAALVSAYPAGSVEQAILTKMLDSNLYYRYDSLEQLQFELLMRKEIIAASYALNSSGMSFQTFRNVKANPQFWQVTREGGWRLKPGVSPSSAINDIFTNGRSYGTECATAMVILYYKALLNIFGPASFDQLFTNIHLMNWHYIDRRLREIGLMSSAGDFLPGDRLYIRNPDVNPETPQWQGENVIDLGGGRYYGHGMGISDIPSIIAALNRNRARGASRSAYLMQSVGRPDFKSLANLYHRSAMAAA